MSASALPALAEDKAPPPPTEAPAPAPSSAKDTAAPTPTPERPASERKSRAQREIPFLGIGIINVPEPLTAQLKLKPGFGLLVTNVEGPAEQAGLQENDVLLMLNDQHLIEGYQLTVLVRNQKPGDEVTLTYVRGGETKTVKLNVGKRLIDAREARLPRPVATWETERGNIMRREAFPGQDKRIIIKGPNATFEQSLPNLPVSRTVIRDGRHEYELQVEGGKNVFVVREEGKEQFRGGVDSDEERGKVPQEFRDSLKRMEAIRAKVTPPSVPLPPLPPGSPMSSSFVPSTGIVPDPQITADCLMNLDPTIIMQDEQ
ncbi:MAG TPA: PDZ domain-containing protein [Candidatus Methylacidiphilales bacterium]|nr:PDZ domain-containing protein [Candidatus Methylacidiphilales bacterium]